MKSKNVKYVSIFDTTLRDGEQTPGVSLTTEEKLEIARQLDRLGVDVIEAGTPISSEGEKRAVREITKAGLNAEICALARTTRVDVDAAIACDVGSVHTFISTSDVQMKHAVNMTPEQVLSATIDSVEYIKDHGLICEFSPMDATRTEINFLKRVCKAAEEAGADRINIPDTVGIMTPVTMRKLIEDVKSVVGVPISVHCHNDFGMAVANSLAGVEAGASQIHVTVNGLGERAGNAALEEVVMALHLIYNRKTGINTKLLYDTSRLVAKLTGVMIQPNKAIVGENAFAHESGIHTRGVTVVPLTFEPIKPELVGRKRKLVAGKLSGTSGIKAELKEAGIYPNKDQLGEIVRRVKELGDKGKTVTDADLLAITRSVMGKVVKEKRIVDLTDLAVVTGIRVIPTASVRLVLDGKEYVTSETGLGPVDAAIKAVQKLTADLAEVRLKEYRIEATTGGSDAMGEVIIKVEDRDGNVVSARATHEDIVMASVEAMINAINKSLLKRRNRDKQA
ncbi:MAG: 2-isopropylmalate synthase [Candidatus Bathyarchaeota archaeon BA2]|nr:MAG: 2-isopropylmalate synthase [Candidatus Bathyarchaeota archaeon BA2]